LAGCCAMLIETGSNNRIQGLLLQFRKRFTREKKVRARALRIKVSGGLLAGYVQAAPRDERAIGRRDMTDNRVVAVRVIREIAGLQDRKKNKTGNKKKRRTRMRAEGLGSQDRQGPPAAGERERAASAEGLGPQHRQMPPVAGSGEDGWNKTDGIPKVRWDK
jgi:hypothetical protein